MGFGEKGVHQRVTARSTDGQNVVIRSNPIQQGALVVIIISLLGQMFATVWWASSITTTLGVVKDDMVTLKNSSILITSQYNSSQEEAATTRTKLDGLRAEFNTVRDNGSPITDRRLTALELQLHRDNKQ